MISSIKSQYRILLVDDEPDITLSIKIGLEEHKKQIFVVDTFNDPQEALSNFKAGLYDLLLIDIKMPKMNGFELYREIEKIDNKAKVCFITAFEVYYKSLRELFPTVKVDCYIKKPITTDDLVERIKSELVTPASS
ncbi:MAG: response regulator transcription factor [Nitrososphaeraceae archaeon]